MSDAFVFAWLMGLSIVSFLALFFTIRTVSDVCRGQMGDLRNQVKTLRRDLDHGITVGDWHHDDIRHRLNERHAEAMATIRSFEARLADVETYLPAPPIALGAPSEGFFDSEGHGPILGGEYKEVL